MPVRHSEAVWEGNLKEGHGLVRLGTGAFQAPFTFSSRFETGAGTNPEELIAAAHAGCFSMALCHGLSQAGFAPIQIQTEARAHLEPENGGFRISHIDLECEAEVPGIDEESFHDQAETAKQNCPISKVLAGTHIKLHARLRQASKT